MFDADQLARNNGTSSTVSIKDWLLLDCIGLLNIIPIIGSIACLVIYAIIAFGQSSAPSMRNRLLASLIWFAIWFVLMFVFIFFLGGMGIIAGLASSI